MTGAETVESGEVWNRGRTGWALTHSSKAGLSERPQTPGQLKICIRPISTRRHRLALT
jgi:restriction endonuclease Mrr